MCGICGAVGSFDRDSIRVMSDAMVHRGPDDEGFFHAPGVSLGHRRLSIIDVSGGHQPLSNEDGSVWVSFNGEIYNHRRLREKLRRRHAFKTLCDTEVIIHLYEEMGDRCVEELRGMFAFAIWDSKQRRLLLARDHFGIKPLYYAEIRDGIAFASEVKALTAAGFTSPEVNEDALPSFLDFRYVTGTKTMFKRVKRLAPGSILTLGPDGRSLRRYWALGESVTTRRSNLTEVEAVSEFLRLLRESVEMRLMSEVPLGAFLSGGLDSSLIVGLMSRTLEKPVKTFTASLEGDWHDEAPYAAIVAEAFGTDHHPLRVEADASGLLDRVVWHLDEPLGDAATIPTFLLSELTRRHVTVALTGTGADELLAGYAKYKAFKYGSRLRAFIGGPHFRLASLLLRASPILARGAGFLGRRDPVAAYRQLTSVFSDDEKRKLAGPRLKHLVGEPGPVEAAMRASRDPVEQMIALDVDTWLPNDVLLKYDKMGMAHSLEARVPFLDHVLAEFVASLPSRLKLRGNTEKYLLRKAMQPIVPKPITKRRKHGFTVPIDRWIGAELSTKVAEALAPERIHELGYWDPAFVCELRKKSAGNAYPRRQLVSLLMFDRWHRVFVEGQKPTT